MSNLTPSASWDAVIQLEGTMAGVPATWNTPNQALLNRTEWLKQNSLVLDSEGNLAMNGATASWGSGKHGFQIGSYSAISDDYSAGAANVTQNAYNSATGWRYLLSSWYAGRYEISGQTHKWYGAGIGAVGASVSWVQFLSLDAYGLLALAGVPIGYGTGSGGAVTQATSKSTAVTINKPSGQITMNGASLAAGARVQFQVNNTAVAATDAIALSIGDTSASYGYIVTAYAKAGAFVVDLKNDTASALAQAVVINFTVIKGANA